MTERALPRRSLASFSCFLGAHVVEAHILALEAEHAVFASSFLDDIARLALRCSVDVVLWRSLAASFEGDATLADHVFPTEPTATTRYVPRMCIPLAQMRIFPIARFL